MSNNSRILNLFNHNNKDGVQKEIPRDVDVAINIIDGKVVIAFREPIKAVTFTRQHAISLANILITAACDKTVK